MNILTCNVATSGKLKFFLFSNQIQISFCVVLIITTDLEYHLYKKSLQMFELQNELAFSSVAV